MGYDRACEKKGLGVLLDREQRIPVVLLGRVLLS